MMPNRTNPMHGRLVPGAAAATVAVLLAACASPGEHAIFVTKTSLAVLDADATPASISIAYDRTEAYAGPRFADGQVAPVAGSIETDGHILGRRIRQVYATGDAALFATTPIDQPLPPAMRAPRRGEATPRVMVFGTSTSLGLKLGFAEGTVVPNAFTLGYRRKEASVIPVAPGVFPSVIGVLQSDVDAADGSAPAFGIAQLFATGDAAAALARRDDVRHAFADRTVQAVSPLQVYRSEEARQGREVLDLLACLSRLPDDRLARVWNNAEALGVFESAGLSTALATVRGAPTPAAQREAYTGEIGLLNADSAAHTRLLELHREAVCRLARP